MQERCLDHGFKQEHKYERGGSDVTNWQPGFNFSSDFSDRRVPPSGRKTVPFVRSRGRGGMAEDDEERSSSGASDEQLIRSGKRFD